METLIEEFMTHFFTSGKSSQTIKSYRKNLLQFCREKRIFEVSHLSRDAINDFVLTLRRRNISDGTIANHLWAIKGFLKWLHEEKQIDCYSFDIKIPFVKPPEIVEYLEPEELETIFSFIDLDSLDGLRLRTFIEVMINTGLRPSEALSLRRDQVSGDEFIIIGKGKKPRKIYVNQGVHTWIDLYLSRRTDAYPEIFISHPKYAHIAPRQMDITRMQEQFRWCFALTGINKAITLHTLRHTYATTLLANGCPLDYVAVLLGHSKIETTRRHYVSIQHKHAKKAHFRFLSYRVDKTESGSEQALNNPSSPYEPFTRESAGGPKPQE